MNDIQSTNKDTPPKPRRRSFRNWLASWSRWLHIYFSMFGLAVTLFFSFTGLTLNHPDWFPSRESEASFTGKLDPQWFESEVDKLAIVEHFRNTHAIRAPLKDFVEDENQIVVAFAGPGYLADAFVELPSGSYELNELALGWTAVVNDLHKGRDTGPVWSVLIDVSAILMTFISVTGLVLIFWLRRTRRSGLTIAAVGCALSAMITWWVV